MFGHGNWSRETVLLEPLHDPKLVPDEDDPSKTKVGACFVAKARVTVFSPDGQRSVVREGFGAARGFGRTVGDAMENALKAAETDALKRALVTFGNAFGLALYNKEQRNVAALPAPRYGLRRARAAADNRRACRVRNQAALAGLAAQRRGSRRH